MESRNVQTYRAGHQAFNRRDFAAVVGRYAAQITWTDRARGLTFKTPEEFTDEFLPGWIAVSSDIQVSEPTYVDAGGTVVCLFTGTGTQDGPLGPFPATGMRFALPLCEMWHFNDEGEVVGGDLYYDQLSLLTQLGLMPAPSTA
jgi:hypothetical protein